MKLIYSDEWLLFHFFNLITFFQFNLNNIYFKVHKYYESLTYYNDNWALESNS